MIKTFDSNIEPEGDKQIQADFSCEITSDKSNKTKIHESFEIVGFDKTLLNPVLADELINTGTITNYKKVPFIDGNQIKCCSKEGLDLEDTEEEKKPSKN